MKITRALSLLYSLAISCGFSQDSSTWTRRRRHDRHPYSFQRARHHANPNHQLVYFTAYSASSSSSSPVNQIAATKNNNNRMMDHVNTSASEFCKNDLDSQTEIRTTATTKSKRATNTSSKVASGSSSAEKQQRDGGSVLKSKQKVSKPGGQVKREKITDGDVRKGNLRDEERWNARFNELLEYKQQYGDCLVPNVFEENPQLGRWVNSQRREPKAMSDDKIQRLEDIGFEWDPFQRQWELRFWHLVEYKRQYGDCLVPTEFEDNRQLGQWVEYQRQRYKRVPNQMSKNHIQRLEELGFEWDPLKAQWESRFLELVEYKHQYGNCLVTHEFEEKHQLATWVDKQRRNYKRVPKTISDDRIQRLEEIGFEWDVLQAQWEFRFQQLVEYKHHHGDCLVPRHSKENPQLGHWVNNQRKNYKSEPKKISDERIQQLVDIGFEWKVGLRDQWWEIRFQQLVQYKQQHGNCMVPRLFQENPQLGNWVAKQRAFYKRVPKAISNYRIQRLEALDFEWI